MYKKTCLGLLLFLCGSSLASDRIIEIDISEQRLYLYKNKSLEASYPISTSKYGEGSIENSYKITNGREINSWLKTSGGVIIEARINTNTNACFLWFFKNLLVTKLNFAKKNIISGNWKVKPQRIINFVIVFTNEIKFMSLTIISLTLKLERKFNDRGVIKK